jgi:DTW domain-containing protein YfiP
MVRRCVQGAELFVGLDFHAHPRLSVLLSDSGLAPFLLHPGPGSLNPQDPEVGRILGGRRMLMLVPDGTWRQARQILRFNPHLAALPRLGLDGPEPGLVTYRRQPAEGCLSTLEAVHQALLGLQAFCPSGPPRALHAMKAILRHVVDEQVALGGCNDSGPGAGVSNR